MKRHEKNLILGLLTTHKYFPGQKTSESNVPGLEPEKVENHCPKQRGQFYVNYKVIIDRKYYLVFYYET